MTAGSCAVLNSFETDSVRTVENYITKHGREYYLAIWVYNNRTGDLIYRKRALSHEAEENLLRGNTRKRAIANS